LHNYLQLKLNVYELHQYDVALWDHLSGVYKTQNELLKK